MKQGRVYFPPIKLPPEQTTEHRVIILSNNSIISRAHPKSFLICAIIRSAINQSGRSVGRVPGHTIPVEPNDFTVISPNNSVINHTSLIETHQLFHISTETLSNISVKALGDLNPLKLQEVLSGARKLLT